MRWKLVRPPRYRAPAVNTFNAETTRLHLNRILERGERFQPDELVLAGMALACGLRRFVFRDTDTSLLDRVGQEVAATDQPWRLLVSELDWLVRQAVAAGRH